MSPRQQLPKGLSADARIVLTEAMRAGWTYQASNRGHLILKHPDGVNTASLPPRVSARNRGYQNALAAIRRHPVEQETPDVPAKPKPSVFEFEKAKPDQAEPQPEPEARPLKRADGTLYEYLTTITDDGPVSCTYPGCDWVGVHRGAHLHETKHTGDVTRGQKSRAAGLKSAEIRAQRKAHAIAAVTALADYLGVKVDLAEDLAKVTAERDDLKAKLALIKEATRL